MEKRFRHFTKETIQMVSKQKVLNGNSQTVVVEYKLPQPFWKTICHYVL